MGMFIGAAAIIAITVPTFMPIVSVLGFDPIWFAVIFLLNMEMAATTPPFGVILIVMKGVAPPDTSIRDVYLAGLPFLVLGSDACVRVDHSAVVFPARS